MLHCILQHHQQYMMTLKPMLLAKTILQDQQLLLFLAHLAIPEHLEVLLHLLDLLVLALHLLRLHLELPLTLEVPLHPLGLLILEHLEYLEQPLLLKDLEYPEVLEDLEHLADQLHLAMQVMPNELHLN